MSTFNTIQNAIPQGGVPGTGQFPPVLNILPDTFNTPTGLSDPPYNAVIIGDSSSNIVGSATTPYLPVALPAYIPTLYANMYYVQTNLKNTIPTDVIQDNNREYPTSYAVKQYVASQLAGSEYLVPDLTNDYSISTGLTTTFLASSDLAQSPNVVSYVDTVTGMTTYVTTFGMNPIDSARVGAQKVCINSTPLGVVASGQTNVLQIVLSTNQYFVVNGKQYGCYAYSNLGDTLTMFQFVNTNVTPPTELFFVITYGGLFSQSAYYVPN